MASEIISTEATNSPMVDLDSSLVSFIEKDAEERQKRIDQELFEENKDWCEQYRCKYERGFWGGVKAYAAKLIDKLIAFALDIIYGLLDALAVAINLALSVLDEILVFLCYLVMLIGNLFLDRSQVLRQESYSYVCGDCSSLIKVISEFVKMICNGILALYNLIMDIIFSVVKLIESLGYECECLRYDAEQDEEKKEAVEEQMGNRASEVKTVDKVPAAVDAGEAASPTTGDTDAEPNHYVVVGDDSPVPSTWFKKHVQHTIDMYNFNPGCEGYILVSLSSYTWKAYVWFLVWNWLSLSNVRTKTNPEGFTWEEHTAQLEYCEKNMPEHLYASVLKNMVSGDF